MSNAKAIQWLRIVSVWLNNLRDERDLQQAIDKIDEVVKMLEEESGKARQV